MKKKGMFFLLLITVGILLYSMTRIEKHEKTISDYTHDVKEKVVIGKQELEVVYVKGNGIDETLTFGNISSKRIKIKNLGQEIVSFAIALKNAEISNQLLTYDVSFANKEDDSFEIISTNNTFNSNKNLVYNMGLKSGEEMVIEISFKANLEFEETKIKGIIEVKNNLSEIELFLEQVFEAHQVLEEKISRLKGISEKGIYTVSVDELLEESKDFKGIILVDARDIVDIKYYDSITNGKYSLDHVLFSNTLSKKNVGKSGDIDINEETLCKAHSRESCQKLSILKENPYGGMNTFTSNVASLLEKAKQVTLLKDKEVIVLDIKADLQESNGLEGYILVHQKEQAEYYLYITNKLYMVSGYNVTKYGMFNETSGTIRAFNETAFNVAALNAGKVCEFTGFTDCYNLKGEKV